MGALPWAAVGGLGVASAVASTLVMIFAPGLSTAWRLSASSTGSFSAGSMPALARRVAAEPTPAAVAWPASPWAARAASPASACDIMGAPPARSATWKVGRGE